MIMKVAGAKQNESKTVTKVTFTGGKEDGSKDIVRQIYVLPETSLEKLKLLGDVWVRLGAETRIKQIVTTKKDVAWEAK
ncbi:hypothetical protein JOC36_001545 [Weissella uvarum]|uniref:hypothetical protein n=1 Tax=Weissella uvarum TaxID=1479233 RepID=UPI001960D8C7|nr:hypothetical protein [Weissella uvarum]MBM7617951.1 hypothetical protein [Weissella uvarum]MCM0596170.1 hypothetical protein [Weissella uvarum]